MFHVSLDGFDKIRDQVMAPRELYIDLGESIAHTVALIDQSVVDTN